MAFAFCGCGRFRPHPRRRLAQIRASREEPGCLEYTYADDVKTPWVMRVLERWESWQALDAHFARPHMIPWRAALASISVAERNLSAHEVRESRKI
jgi:quinol monooxygenase YgiN